mmetsp:Transcript_5699/g.8868  ORF Transcript_5699/g.8868 Transcript_5699/m.8868 type:complete len:312 (+) Transcript_5699:102-1037(+)|eukprot:CAMPEP_0203774712 /NCGR_PEP_ID=MMETSP0099_2-20121227/5537_1 /ASSEMBLY_ACC=CAM_ASM_000209 /TAXON_ID=96639 /ORGANISM=" , Strain NY0313808BC1" /LENGTH=311 /DNA_ID=CAMNT_0050673027 /DNA_START=318 /DNA_END=1253 /DNA_ORIENTATION=-
MNLLGDLAVVGSVFTGAFAVGFGVLFHTADRNGVEGWYGIDAPMMVLRYFSMAMVAIITFRLVVLVESLNRRLKVCFMLVLLVVAVTLLMIVASMLHGSIVGKFQVVSQITTELDREGMLGANVRVLDIGCGSGLLGLSIMKHLVSSGVSGELYCIDPWSSNDQSFNGEHNIYANAKLEGVPGSSIHTITGDARYMPKTWTDKFDIVVQALALHNIGEGNFSDYWINERRKAISEVIRVTKSGGGRIVMWDICPGPSSFEIDKQSGRLQVTNCAALEFLDVLEGSPLVGDAKRSENLRVFYESYIIQAIKR